MTANQRAVSTGTLNVQGPHGQPGFRDLSVQRRRGRRLRDRRQDRRSTPVPVMSNALPKTCKGRVAFIFDERDFDVDQIVGVKNIKITGRRRARRARDAVLRSGLPVARCGRATSLVGADNFGYGHPHYPPMRAMRHLGIAGVIAESLLARLLARRDQHGLSAGQLPRNPRLRRTLGRDRGRLGPRTSSAISRRTRHIAFEPLSRADREMLEAGGLVPYLKQSSVA